MEGDRKGYCAILVSSKRNKEHDIGDSNSNVRCVEECVTIFFPFSLAQHTQERAAGCRGGPSEGRPGAAVPVLLPEPALGGAPPPPRAARGGSGGGGKGPGLGQPR